MTEHDSPADVLFPRRCRPTASVSAPRRARLYNCNPVQLSFQSGPPLIRPVIREEGAAERFLQGGVLRLSQPEDPFRERLSAAFVLEIQPISKTVSG